MVQKFSWIFAVVFLAIGILGFVPGITTADGHLLGIFEVDMLHNIIHLVTGLVFLGVATKWTAHASMAFKVFGVVYALVTVVGFLQGDTVLGLIGVNMADNILHLVIALVALYVGFGMKGDAGAGGGSMAMHSDGGNNMNMGHDGGGGNDGQTQM